MENPALSITPETFVQEFKDLKVQLLAGYFSLTSDISRTAALQEAGLSEAQIAVTRCVVNAALTDALNTVLFGLEGSASIHQHQIMYKLFDEQSNELTWHIESIAWEKFQGEEDYSFGYQCAAQGGQPDSLHHPTGHARTNL